MIPASNAVSNAEPSVYFDKQLDDFTNKVAARKERVGEQSGGKGWRWTDHGWVWGTKGETADSIIQRRISQEDQDDPHRELRSRQAANDQAALHALGEVAKEASRVADQ